MIAALAIVFILSSVFKWQPNELTVELITALVKLAL